jgi:hypothetical protein
LIMPTTPRQLEKVMLQSHSTCRPRVTEVPGEGG